MNSPDLLRVSAITVEEIRTYDVTAHYCVCKCMLRVCVCVCVCLSVRDCVCRHSYLLFDLLALAVE